MLRPRTYRAPLAAAVLLASCALAASADESAAPAAGAVVRDAHFVVLDQGDHGPTAVEAVRAELHRGLAALARLGFAPRDGLFPVEVRLMAGGGVSNSFRGRLELYQLHRNEAPVVHELTHVVAGYDNGNGHWSQEGLASFVQDRFGANAAFPTYGMAHALMRLILSDGAALPMAAVMRDRRRETYFGPGTPWERWIAYVQSTSFVAWLVDVHGIERFRRIYGRPVETMDFEGVYGAPAAALIADWQRFVQAQDGPAGAARAIYDRTYDFSRRQQRRR